MLVLMWMWTLMLIMYAYVVSAKKYVPTLLLSCRAKKISCMDEVLLC